MHHARWLLLQSLSLANGCVIANDDDLRIEQVYEHGHRICEQLIAARRVALNYENVSKLVNYYPGEKIAFGIDQAVHICRFMIDALISQFDCLQDSATNELFVDLFG